MMLRKCYTGVKLVAIVIQKWILVGNERNSDRTFGEPMMGKTR